MFFWDIVIHLTKGVFEVEGEKRTAMPFFNDEAWLKQDMVSGWFEKFV